jgi:hypothetical protein
MTAEATLEGFASGSRRGEYGRVDPHLSIGVADIGSVAHETARIGKCSLHE